MMMGRSLAVAIVSLAAGASVEAEGPVAIAVRNPTDQAWAEAPVVVPWDKDMEAAWSRGCCFLSGPDTPVFQRDDLDGDGQVDELVFLASLKPRETKEYRLTREGKAVQSPPRAHAGMYLRGMLSAGWEPEVMAYRIYWNADTAIDIFGKTAPILSLKPWGTGGINHHVESKYGVDVLKVDKSLGVGGFGVWLDGAVWKISDTLRAHFVRADGPIRAVLEVQFVDWYTGPGRKQPGKSGPGLQRRFDLTALMSIFAGQRWGEARLFIKPVGGGTVPEMVTGVVKHEETELIQLKDKGIVGRWGRQALGDNEVPKASDLGLAVLVDPQDVVAYGEDELNSYVRLKLTRNRVRYLYHGSWVKEPGGAKSAGEYEAMLRAMESMKPEVRVTTDK